MKYSYSSLSTFEECPKKFELHYLKRIRPKRIESPLFFGSALDEGFSRLLMTKKKILTDEEKLLVPKTATEIFLEFMNESELATNHLVEYSAKDFSPDFLYAQDLIQLQKFDSEIFDFYAFYEECRETIKNKKKLSQVDQKTFNLMNWLSLKNKGLELLKAYELEVLPQIHEVFHIQKTIALDNGIDEITGKIDFICSFVDNPDQKYICDNKTSSKAYSDDSVKESLQLAMYCESEQILDASYVVVEKEIRKKEPRVRISVIKDKISEESFEKAFQRVDNLVNLIKSGNFPMKDDKKNCYAFGKKCPYYNLCWSGKMDGLEEKK